MPATAACVGDCNGNEEVTADELITIVNIALGNAELSTCPVDDVDGNGEITIDQILQAVNNALSGCTPSPPPYTVGQTLAGMGGQKQASGAALRALARGRWLCG